MSTFLIASAGTLLAGNITGTGMYQGDLFTFLTNTVTAVNETMTDHATTVTLDTDNKTLTNAIRSYHIADRLVSGNPALAIEVNFDVKPGNAFVAQFDEKLFSIAVDTCDTGTSANFAIGQWAIFGVEIDSAGTYYSNWATNTTAGYSTEALAIAALPALTTDRASIGYVTVQAKADADFTAGTDALTTGTGGDVAQATNYYNKLDPNGIVSAAITSSPPGTLSASPLSLSDL